MTRNVLPQRRHAETFSVRFWDQDWIVTIGFYGDHTSPGEVFVSSRKSGSEVESTARDGAILLSLAIQHGVPIETITSALTRNADGAPSTLIGVVAELIAKRPVPA